MEQRVRPLEGFEPAGEEENAVAGERELVAEARGVAGAQHAKIDTGRGNTDSCPRGAVQAHQVAGLGDAAGHQPVCARDQACLGERAPLIHGQPGPRLGARQGVEGLHPWDEPHVAELLGHQPAQPVVSMDYRVATALDWLRGR